MTDPEISDRPPESDAAWIASSLRPIALKVDGLTRDCRESASVDAVHDLRVATRRLREALRLVGLWTASVEQDALRRRLRRVTRGLGPVRNCDVAAEFFGAPGIGDDADWPAGSALARGWVLRRCAALRRGALPGMRRLLDEADCRKVPGEVERLLDVLCAPLVPEAASSRPFPSARDLAPVVLRSRLEEALAGRHEMPTGRSTAVDDPDWREPMHRTRIALKKLRYALEFLAPASPAEIAACLQKLRTLQDAFGALQDLVTFGRMLELGTSESLVSGWIPGSYEKGLAAMRARLAELAEAQSVRAAGAFRRRLVGEIRPALFVAFPEIAE